MTGKTQTLSSGTFSLKQNLSSRMDIKRTANSREMICGQQTILSACKLRINPRNKKNDNFFGTP
jgi:hypothetical protein